jgi:hypothetical protein
VVARTKINFSKELGTALNSSKEVINDKNGEFFFNGEFVESTEVRTSCEKNLIY